MSRCKKEQSNLGNTPGFIFNTTALEHNEELDVKIDSNLKSKYPSRKRKAVLEIKKDNKIGSIQQIVTPTSDNRIFDIVRLNERLQSFTKCVMCDRIGICLREVRLVGVSHIYELYCEFCDDTSNWLKRKRRKEILDTSIYSTIYQTENDLLISPLVRQVEIKRERSFMNYAVNVQFLLAAFYIGHSGNTLDFLMGSLDLPNAQTMHQHYYQN